MGLLFKRQFDKGILSSWLGKRRGENAAAPAGTPAGDRNPIIEHDPDPRAKSESIHPHAVSARDMPAPEEDRSNLLDARFQARKADRLERRRQWDSLQRREAETSPAPEAVEPDGPASAAQQELSATAAPALETNPSSPVADIEGYRLPDPALLDVPEDSTTVSAAEIDGKTRVIQDTLDSFGIDAEVQGATSGPRVTMYKIEPARGVKVEAIAALRNNLAMELAARSIRILAPIPGHSYVGIEVPNDLPGLVKFRSSLEAPEWSASKATLPLILGVSVDGRQQIFDLARAPHLLIAGATGSGKSVCLNTALMSLLYRFTPDELRLVLVDPKIVEFAPYEALPHLAIPVIHSAAETVGALKWVITEMERRYKLLAAEGFRNIRDYNRQGASSGRSGSREASDADAAGPEKLPYLVVVIDELADIMMTEREAVENRLARIAQLSRAVGIHTIIATQRPSVNVITGIIKANYPARIAFQVASQVDSRTIVDVAGAESLLGQGDMLFASPEIPGLQRIQGVFVTDDEVRRVVEAVSEHAEAVYSREALLQIKAEQQSLTTSENALDADDEPLFREAADIVIRDRRASTSYIQRRLRIGYNRAALLMEEMERRGVVGPPLGSNQREILLDEVPQWQ